jgi:hypothetical protein
LSYEDFERNPFRQNEDLIDSISPINQTSNAIDNVDFEIQIKSIVSRIKDYTVQIKERVRNQKKLSESFLQLANEEVTV